MPELVHHSSRIDAKSDEQGRERVSQLVRREALGERDVTGASELLVGPLLPVGKNAALRGLGSAMTSALGVFTADLAWMTASVIGLAAVLDAFEPAFLADE
jgi:hypothetical protein